MGTVRGGLWRRVAAHAEGRLAKRQVQKIKSHIGKAVAAAGGCPVQGWETDRLAGLLAKRAACMLNSYGRAVPRVPGCRCSLLAEKI